MTLEQLALADVYLIHGHRVSDERGWFWKTYKDIQFEELSLDFTCRETFFSMSSAGVIRGMHFQVPPKAHAKLVTCLVGEVFDALLDLRIGSPTYGNAISVKLSGESNDSIFVPEGIAHGFCVMSANALMCYQTSEPYDPGADCGVLWNSVPLKWPCLKEPIISKRDKELPSWINFESPF